MLDLLDSTGVLTVQGSGFGREFGAGHFRIVYLPPENVLEEAMDKIESFVSEIKQIIKSGSRLFSIG